MKKKTKIIIMIVLLFVISMLLIFLTFSNESSSYQEIVEYEEKTQKAQKRDLEKTLTAPGEVFSAKEESLSLNTNYYYQSMCAEENQIIKKGEKILKYSNGKYIEAPYNCIITDYYVPAVNKKCDSSNYIKISSIEDLYMNVNITEQDLDKVSLGQEVELVINYDESKVYQGTISKINETGTYNNGVTNFTAIVSIKNDGNLKLGMSATCKIIIEKCTDLLCVPIEAVTIENGERYVIVKNGDKKNKVIVETGKSDANYVEITSGLNENDEIYYESQTITQVESEDEEDSKSKNLFQSIMGGDQKQLNRQGGKRK